MMIMTEGFQVCLMSFSIKSLDIEQTIHTKSHSVAEADRYSEPQPNMKVGLDYSPDLFRYFKIITFDILQ